MLTSHIGSRCPAETADAVKHRTCSSSTTCRRLTHPVERFTGQLAMLCDALLADQISRTTFYNVVVWSTVLCSREMPLRGHRILFHISPRPVPKVIRRLASTISSYNSQLTRLLACNRPANNLQKPHWRSTTATVVWTHFVNARSHTPV